jgi:hypothetical protein
MWRSTIVDFTPENHLTDIGASMPISSAIAVNGLASTTFGGVSSTVARKTSATAAKRDKRPDDPHPALRISRPLPVHAAELTGFAPRIAFKHQRQRQHPSRCIGVIAAHR